MNSKIIYLWAQISQAEVCKDCSLTISWLRAYFGKVCSEHTLIKEETYYIRSIKGHISACNPMHFALQNNAF